MKVLVLILIFILPAISNGKSFKTEKGDFNLVLPKNWNSLRNIYGFTVAIIGPDRGDIRAVIGITPTGLEEEILDIDEIIIQKEKIKESKKKWVLKRKGEFLNVKVEIIKPWSNLEKIRLITSEYILKNMKRSEQSYYVKCKKSSKIFHIKALQVGHTIRDKKMSDKILGSFKCE